MTHTFSNLLKGINYELIIVLLILHPSFSLIIWAGGLPGLNSERLWGIDNEFGG